jgi:hypothetical protein
MKLGLGISALGILTLLSTAGCGRHAEATRSPASEAPAQKSAGYGASADAVGEAAPASPTAGGYAESGRSPERLSSRAPKDEERSRPGLGTSWGEAVSSRVSTTSFHREDDDSPDATTSFFYNDEHGVSAMTRGRFVDWNESVTRLAPGVSISITDPSGRALPAARVDGRIYAVGHDGDRYVIHVDNRSGVRVEAVATVDGLDVIDGEDGSLEKRGYVIAPYGSLDIEGFRESEGSVRAFRFGSTNDSYASRRGKGRNVGVIGVALFRERGTGGRWTAEEVERRETADPFPNRFAPPPPPVGYRAH